jgi:homoserine O-succinyltransferase/O-acetyltransferase
MVVNIESTRSTDAGANGRARLQRRTMRPGYAQREGHAVTIGLLNNMAGTAFKGTERQFLSLLDSASEGVPIHVSFYTLPGMSRAEAGGQHFASHYQTIDALMDTHLDGLIVTGREPKMASLRDETYWDSFTQVLEWARTNTHSTVWSCLAAHAAVLHMDGIERHRSDEKKFGVFECAQSSDHPLTSGVAPRFHVPHSRWNGVAESDLTKSGYSVLSRICGDGVDAFVKQERSLFVFFQGHLEYESDTLMREYRRDVGRYVKGEARTYPLLPSGYFDGDTEAALMALRDKADSFRGIELLTRVAAAVEETRPENAWKNSASVIYKNWLQTICARKSERDERFKGANSVLRSADATR